MTVAIETTPETVAPRDALELKLHQIWEELLEHRPIGVHDNFFELGGDSVLALTLLAMVVQETSYPLPAGGIFAAPTISKLAAMLREELDPDSWSALVPIHPEGNLQPLFCIHPGGGNVLCYMQLSRALGPDQPFYGLQAPGVDGIREPLTSVKDMAEEYLLAIRKVRPRGPYALAGWSAGGVIAFEIAQRLRTAGEEVSTLAILDSGALYTLGVIKAMFSGGESGAVRMMCKTSADQVADFRERSAPAQLVPEAADDDLARQIYDLFRLNVNLAIDYRAQTYGGRLDVFQAREHLVSKRHQPFLEWSRVCDNVHLHEVDGNHLTMMHDPHVNCLAKQLADVLAATPSV